MKDDQADRLIDTLAGHGNQLGNNLVHLKKFTERLQREQHTFLAEQRQASDKAQKMAQWAAVFSAVAAVAAAFAAGVSAYVDVSARQL